MGVKRAAIDHVFLVKRDVATIHTVGSDLETARVPVDDPIRELMRTAGYSTESIIAMARGENVRSGPLSIYEINVVSTAYESLGGERLFPKR